MTDVSNLDDLANAIASSSSKIKAYAQAQAAATQSQELAIADLDARLKALEHPAPPPPPPPTGNFVFDASGMANISDPPWSTAFSYASPGYVDVSESGPITQTSDGRVKVTAAPDGVGTALRCEIRDSDLPWPVNTANDRAHLRVADGYTWGKPALTVGEVYYFDFELWLPNNNPVGEHFDYPTGNWLRLWEPHDHWGLYSSCFSVVSDGLPLNNAWMPLRVSDGGAPTGSHSWSYYPLFQLTNSDGSWHTQNFNRRLHIRYGGRFAPDNSGWFEAFVDGSPVVPRRNGPTMWAGDESMYLVPGLYKASSSNFVHTGACVLYYMNMRIEKVG